GEQVQAHAARRQAHAAGIDPWAAQLAERGAAQGVVGDRPQHRHLVAETGQGHADVGLGAADPRLQPRRLQQQLAPRRPQAQQQLSEPGDATRRARFLDGGVRLAASAVPATRSPAARPVRGGRRPCGTFDVAGIHYGPGPAGMPTGARDGARVAGVVPARRRGRPVRRRGRLSAPVSRGDRGQVMPRNRREEAARHGITGRAATINDIARLAGVSKKTVSRVINRSPLVRADTREKVEALMREVGYVPDPLARGLAFRRSFLIGMIYDNPTAQYIVDFQYGALDAMRNSGFDLVVHPCDSRSPDYVSGVRSFVLQQKLHGVMLVPRVSEDQALADMLQEVGCRYARVAAVCLDAPERSVITHDRDGAAEVADYLQTLGHRDIAMITGPAAYRSAMERTEGFV